MRAADEPKGLVIITHNKIPHPQKHCIKPSAGLLQGVPYLVTNAHILLRVHLTQSVCTCTVFLRTVDAWHPA